MIVRTFGYKELQPYGNFQLVEHPWRAPGNAEVALVGASATLIGWIPFCNDRDNLANGFLKEAWGKDNASIPILLRSGNNAPPESFSGPGSLHRFMGLKDFRVALSIDAPTLYLDAHRQPVRLQFLAMAQVGTTPYRLEYLVSPRIWFTMFSGGNARPAGNISQQGDCVKVRLFMRIRIGWLGRIGAMAMGNEEPPWASVMMEYAFHYHEGFGRATFWGSAVPAQDHYVDWRRVSRYDMERDMTRAAYEGFVTAGGDMDAMSEGYETHLVGLREISVSSDHIKSFGSAVEETDEED